jgi:superfamily II RNA helicase
MVSLLEKGIAIHHAGVMPILREMVEMLFAKGYIKLLFATETFAVGINMPTKSVLFTDIHKFDGNNVRPMYSHEYTQMAGRAGRRGIDTIGHVIHLTNLFRETDQLTTKQIMKGTPQRLSSKFKISESLILQLIANGISYSNIIQYVKQSMLRESINSELNQCQHAITTLTKQIDVATFLFPLDVLDSYFKLTNARKTSVNKARREIDKKIEQIKEEYKNIESEMGNYNHYLSKQTQLHSLRRQELNAEFYFEDCVKDVCNHLVQRGFLEIKGKEEDEEEDKNNHKDTLQLTTKGVIAGHIREVDCLLFADLFVQQDFHCFTSNELIAVFSCFTNISVPESKRTFLNAENTIHSNLKQFIMKLRLKSESNDMMHFDLIDYVMEWSECEDEMSCKHLLEKMKEEKEIFLGEFVKALQKIHCMTNEFIQVAELLGDTALLALLNEIPGLILKFVATNQSLYV